jgi:tellurite methyltransferase
MTKSEDGGYESGYQACDRFWAPEPGTYVRKLIDLVGDCSGLRVLDVGCGEGKNAAIFAEMGASVVGVEISRRALEHARALYPGANVAWVCADATRETWPPEHFDIVIAYGLFHCLSSEVEIQRLQRTLAESTKLGGRHVVCSFNNREQDLSAHPGFTPFLGSHEFYRLLYRGWAIEASSDETLYETHPHNNIPHHHSLSRLIARKSS